MSEELGIKVNENDLIPYKILKSDKPTHKEFQQIFALVLDNKKNFRFEKDEIDQLLWRDIKEVKSILVDKKDENWVQKPWDKRVLNWLVT